MSDWKNVQYKDGKYRTSEGGGGGSSTFAGLDDVSFSDLQNGQVPKYNSTTQKWENANESGGGTVTDVEVDGVSVVNQQGVAEIEMPTIPVKDVEVDGQSVVNAQGIAEITMPTPPTPDYPVTDVKVNGTSVVNNKEAQITSYKELTLAEYQALPSSKLNDGVMYCIKDIGGANQFPPLIYSDEEREIGVWRDGKPLYQKTVYFGGLPSSATSKSVAHGISNLDRLVAFYGATKQNNSYQQFPIPWTARNRVSNQTQCSVDATNIQIVVGEDKSDFNDVYITLQYTKTTDTAGSGTWNQQGGYTHHYSENEKVVGTWIDGKPLYEKTIQYTPSSTISSNTVIGSIANAKEMMLVFAYGYNSSANRGVFLAYADSSARNSLSFDNGAITLVVNNDSWSSSWTINVVVQYTKTTD